MRHKLLVAVDGKEPTWKLADYVGHACAEGLMEVVVYHVLPPLPPYIEAGESVDSSSMRERYETVAREGAEKMVRAVRDRLVKAGGSADRVREEIEENEGDAAGQIVEAAKRHGCDTIVVGRPARSMIGEFFRGSVVEHLLRKPVGVTLWVVE